MKKLAIMLTILSTSASASNLQIETSASAFRSAGHVGNNMAVACNHSVKITNPTGANEFPNVYYKMCIEGGKCIQKHFQQKVNNGTFSNSYQSLIETSFRNPGHYTVSCTTDVDQLKHTESSNDITIY